MPILLIATLDTKGPEIAFVRDRLRAKGLETIVVDAGSMGPPTVEADVNREELFHRSGTSFGEIRARGDRGHAVAKAAEGAARLAEEWASRGDLEGILAIGGSAGSTIGSAAMRAAPFGVPKLLVCTLASGDMRPYVGGSDILVMHPVLDLAGLNRLTETVLANASEAMAGMVVGRRENLNAQPSRKPVIAATMFGVTTPCVDHARKFLEIAGFEVWVFHATGVGGRAMEALIRDGEISGVLDLTTTELADEHVGGILSAGPDRLKAAIRRGIPQVVGVGALDMVNFGPRSTVPERFEGRNFVVHNPNVTLMRTTGEESAAIGAKMAAILGESRSDAVVLIPERGVSALDLEGRPFFDPEADSELFAALDGGLAGHPSVKVVRLDAHINDPAFAEEAARALIALVRSAETP